MAAPRQMLTQLSGLRACLGLWIVLDHFMAEPRMCNALLSRGMVPVEAFIILSGFLTHYAYGSKPHTSRGQVLRFYARRLGAICVSYYLSWAVMLLFAVLACASGSCIGRHAEPGFGHVQRATGAVASLLLVQSMNPVTPQYPSGPAWTISTMAMLWLLYPKLQAWLAAPLARAPFALAAAAVVGANAPVACAFLFGPTRFSVAPRAYLWLYQWPPLRLCDFVFGMALAQALVDGRAAPGWRGWAALADGAAAATAAACALVPLDPRSANPALRQGWEPLFISGTAPLIGLFLFASSCAGGRGSQVSRACRHGILSGMGQYGLQVYLWHWPLGMLFKGLELHETGDARRGLQGGYLVPYVLCTWLVAAAVSIHLEAPFVRWLRAKVDGWAAADEAAAARGADGAELLDSDAERGAGGAPAAASAALIDAQAARSDGAEGPPAATGAKRG